MSTALQRAAEQQIVVLPQPGPSPQEEAGLQVARTDETPAVVPGEPAPTLLPRPPSAGTARLALRGELSATDRSWLASELEDLVASGARTVEIDLSALGYADMAVARLLVRTEWRLGDVSRKLLLIHPQPQVRRVLQWCGGRHLLVR